MFQDANLHTLTHVVINDLQKAFKTCHDQPTEGLILSAMVTVKKVHDHSAATALCSCSTVLSQADNS